MAVAFEDAVALVEASITSKVVEVVAGAAEVVAFVVDEDLSGKLVVSFKCSVLMSFLNLTDLAVGTDTHPTRKLSSLDMPFVCSSFTYSSHFAGSTRKHLLFNSLSV